MQKKTPKQSQGLSWRVCYPWRASKKGLLPQMGSHPQEGFLGGFAATEDFLPREGFLGRFYTPVGFPTSGGPPGRVCYTQKGFLPLTIAHSSILAVALIWNYLQDTFKSFLWRGKKIGKCKHLTIIPWVFTMLAMKLLTWHESKIFLKFLERKLQNLPLFFGSRKLDALFTTCDKLQCGSSVSAAAFYLGERRVAIFSPKIW